MAFDNKGKAIEQYDAEMAIQAISLAPSEYAALAIFRLLRPEVRAHLRRVVHRMVGERA